VLTEFLEPPTKTLVDRGEGQIPTSNWRPALKNKPIDHNILKYSILRPASAVKQPVDVDTLKDTVQLSGETQGVVPRDVWAQHPNASVVARLISSGVIGLSETASINTEAKGLEAAGTWNQRAPRKMARMESRGQGMRLARTLFG